MRTVRTKIYKFQELEEKAKKKALESMISDDIEPIRDEAHKTLQDIIKELIPLIEVRTILQT
jgi:hypothetical protein